MKKSRIARPIAAVASPAVRSLPLVELLVDTQAELFELMVRSGLRVLDAMLEEDRTALCGPRYAHQPARAASRAGTVPSDVVLGGRKVAVSRPRALVIWASPLWPVAAAQKALRACQTITDFCVLGAAGWIV